MTKSLFLVITLVVALFVTMVWAHSKGQCTYQGLLYSEGAEVTMDGETKQCVCDDDGDNCHWF